MLPAIYLYKSCSTCQKALRFLKQNQIVCETKEITTTPPSVEELKQMLKYVGGDIRKLFNTSGLLYRELQLSHKLKEMPLDQALQLLNQNGMLVKRPFFIGSNFGFVGFQEAQWQQFLLN